MDSKAERKESVKWFHPMADFANLLKAFVGTNYLSLAYGFKESGIAFGLAGLLLVAVLTDHCCCLIVKCKYEAINMLCRKYEEDGGADGNVGAIKRRLYKDIRYPDIGYIVWGKWGRVAINFFLVITQIGFCTNYYIFVGNVLHTLIVDNSDVTKSSAVMPNISNNVINVSGQVELGRHQGTLNLDSEHGENLPFLSLQDKSRQKRSRKLVDSTISPLLTHEMTRSTNAEYASDPILQTSTGFTRPMEMMNISDELQDEIMQSYLTTASQRKTTVTPIIFTAYSKTVGSANSHDPAVSKAHTILAEEPSVFSSTTQSTHNRHNKDKDETVTDSLPDLSVFEKNSPSPGSASVMSSTSSPLVSPMPTQNSSDDDSSLVPNTSTGPALALLVLCPLPLFILFTLYRDVRNMGPISMVANAAVVIGSCSVILYIIIDLDEPADIVWYKWATLPVYLGQVNSCYEAIGTIVSIEGSMKGNRHMYTSCLHGVMALFSLTLCATAFIGYLRYGEDTKQIVIQNLPQDSPLIMAVNVLLIIGVLGTYPLQVFPIIQIVEGYLFSEGAICGPNIPRRIDGALLDDDSSNSSEEEVEAQKSLLMSDDDVSPRTLSISGSIPDRVSAWKRNLFRAFVAIFICGLAVLLRNAIAYVSALIGSIGSCPLAFIIPCLLHMKLKSSSLFIKVKDIVIIILGGAIMIVSTVVTIQELAGINHLEGL